MVLLKMPKTLLRSIGLRRDTLREYRKADFIVNSAAHHAQWHREHHGRPTLYVPNPVERLFDQRPAHTPVHPPRFLLLGGLQGIATSTGLAWFGKHVYPHIESAIDQGVLEVHLAGRLALRRTVGAMERVVRRGYIEDLAAEMSRTTAMLVPTPINLGFRTRVLDSFRHGVTVVAHTANALGMPELADGRNALLASDGASFAEAMLRLAHDPAEAQRLGEAAFEQFDAELNATVTVGRIARFIDESRGLCARESPVSQDTVQAKGL
jgi:glycosyltransferase involved in cell wall biosynthesis